MSDKNKYVDVDMQGQNIKNARSVGIKSDGSTFADRTKIEIENTQSDGAAAVVLLNSEGHKALFQLSGPTYSPTLPELFSAFTDQDIPLVFSTGGALPQGSGTAPVAFAPSQVPMLQVFLSGAKIGGAAFVPPTDALEVDGTVKATGYKSTDGSAGVSGTFTTNDGKTITIKDGLVTSIV